MQNKQAFTLVELIVVVTILAILSTIGFVSYSSYLTWVRDTNRVSNMKAISDWLELYRTKFSLPLPEDNVDIKANGTVIAYQWYAWANVLESIEFSNGWKDPKNDNYYSYYLTKDKKYFQLMWFLEEEDNIQVKLFNQTQAVDYSILYPTVYGKKLGILTWIWTDLNVPIQEIASIVTAWNLDIATTTDSYISYFKDWWNASWTGITLYKLEEVAWVWWYKCWWIEDFIYCLSPAWGTVDSNCEEDDILVWKQVWAGCNSTIWNGIEFVNNHTDSCRNYTWNNLQSCTDAQNLSTQKENAWNSIYGIDNIWWKWYSWDNSSSACISWRHVPSDEEWYNLEVALWSTDRSTNWDYSWIVDWWSSGWLGWLNYTTKTSTNNIVKALNLPLAGFRNTDGILFFHRAYSTHLWSSTVNGTDVFGRYLIWNSNTIQRSSWSKDYGCSIRCIKD